MITLWEIEQELSIFYSLQKTQGERGDLGWLKVIVVNLNQGLQIPSPGLFPLPHIQIPNFTSLIFLYLSMFTNTIKTQSLSTIIKVFWFGSQWKACSHLL